MATSEIRRRAGRLALGVALAGALWLALPLRLADPEVNQVAALCALWVILVGLCLASALVPSRTRVRVVGATCFAILSVLFVVSILVAMVAGGPFVGYELLDSVRLPHSVVRVYRTNGGATTAFGIRVVQETALIPGIVLAKDVADRYPAWEGAVEATGPRSIVITINGKKERHSLRQFTYF